jgi:hypothetical protein
VPADIVALISVVWHQNKDHRPEFTAIVMGQLSFLQTGTGTRTDVAVAAAVTAIGGIPFFLASDLQREHERKVAAKESLVSEAAEHENRLHLERTEQGEEATAALRREREREAADLAARARETKKRELRQI